MSIYKANGKKDGLQKYNVRINYIADSGQSKQLTRTAYGMANAKTLEIKLISDIKIIGEMPMKKMNVQELYDEFIEVKKYETRQRTVYNIQHLFNVYILPMFKNYRIDRITVNDVQNWKISMEKRNLSLATKKRAFIYFSAMINYAIKMEYLQKNPFTKIGNFKDTLNIKPKMNFYTPEEFEKFIKSAKNEAVKNEVSENNLSEWNYYVFFNIAFYTGLRKGEITRNTVEAFFHGSRMASHPRPDKILHGPITIPEHMPEKQLKKARKDIAAIEQKRSKLVDMRLEDIIDKDEYEAAFIKASKGWSMEISHSAASSRISSMTGISFSSACIIIITSALTLLKKY